MGFDTGKYSEGTARNSGTVGTVASGPSAMPPSPNIPSRGQLEQRRGSLMQEVALIDACLAWWTDETDLEIHRAHCLRQLGYRI